MDWLLWERAAAILVGTSKSSEGRKEENLYDK